MLRLTVNATGTTTDDLLLAVEEAARRIEGGFTSGLDRNESGSFTFVITENGDAS